MNNYDRRQHSVLQRMSAFDRYKRKRSQVREHERKTAAADDDTPDQMRTDATAPSVVDQTTPPPPDLDMPLRIIDEVRQSFLNEFGGEDQSVERSVAAQEFARLRDNWQRFGETSQKLVALLRDGRHESFERRSAQISELDKEAPYYFCHLLDPIQKTLKECIQYEQEKKERDEAEQSRLLAHRRERERREDEERVRREDEEQVRREDEERVRREDEERVRREREQKQQEIDEQFQAKRAQTRLRRVKADADRECRRAWIENLQLVIQRRANQAANAG